jgi:excisionase family DNA binding protein
MSGEARKDTLTGELLTVSEAATALRLGERTVRAMLADGRLPRVRLIGVRAVRIPAAAVKAMIA